ncbi:MAG: hypothetical protein JXQ91_03730 [Vannielia sp.]|uniref:spike base protein, RCAP_Rcc01079 family n=1 Tax=Rhodobacterales TaxID=204455 RepID=UPI002095C3D2|nr:hypothetical protein [Oceanicola sp. 502str15]MCO6381958.1 hypothetical protein [Oceanicola sp. 502str15]
MTDNFAGHMRSLTTPAEVHFSITPSDGTDLPVVPRALYCNIAGTAVLRDRNGQEVSYDLAAGQVLPFRAHRVLATGTTAGLIGWE